MQGAILSDVDVRDYKVVCTTKTTKFPKNFELEMVRVKSQGDINSCVAHSLSSIIEYYNNKQNNDPTEMSVGYIYGNRTTSKHKETGMVIRDALEAARLYGDVYKESYGDVDNVEVPVAIDLFEKNRNKLYNEGYSHRISQYCKANTVSAIKTSLMAGNPVLMAMIWYADMEVVDGVLTTSYAGHDGGHCMIIYGWDERGWKVMNSWGEKWGDKGSMIVPYNMKLAECWTLIDNIIEGAVIKKPFSSKAGRSMAKIINKICKFFKK